MIQKKRVLIPGLTDYPPVKGGEFVSYRFDPSDLLALDSDKLQSIISLGETSQCDYVVMSDAISFDMELIARSLIEKSGFDALWGLQYLHSNGHIDLAFPQAFYAQGGAEMAVLSFDGLAGFDHIVSLEILQRYQAVTSTISLASYLYFIWAECFVAKLPLNLWVKDSLSALNGSDEKVLGLIFEQLNTLANSLSTKHRLEIKNKNLLAAKQVFKKEGITVNEENHWGFNDFLPFYGSVDFLLLNDQTISLSTYADDIVASSIFWTGHYEKASSWLWSWLLTNKSYDFCLDLGSYNGFYGLIAASLMPGKPVHAFEPRHQRYGRCVVNQQINLCNNLTVHPLIAANNNGHHVLQEHYLLPDKAGEPRSKKESPAFSISIAEQFADLLSTDHGLVRLAQPEFMVEALEGMRPLLSARKIDLLIKVSANDNVAAIHRLLTQFGYHLYTIDEESSQLSTASELIAGDTIYNQNKLYVREPLNLE
ncbi:MAG: hypothetical protein GY712_04495 [Oceanicoccus sp.]|uniref:hypothetical protein n=1 Tax=Oceanicoccus sp. TaxID=2691044 RepID=UPI00261F8762|nr:hypothetical protein [Oceanicoccus sp.]MCP3907256.1 hypothetical protein [Oceanicoccus sp.]